MTRKARIGITLAFAGSFLAVGLPYWQIPYSQVSLPGAVWGLPLVVVAALAAVSCVISGSRFWPTALIVGASVPAAVMARIIHDTLFDPTSHNLWPFEIVLAAGPGLIAATVGALVGMLLSRVIVT